MPATLEYDDHKLQRMFAELAPKRRRQALKGGFRRQANKVKKAAVGNLRESIRKDRDLERGIRGLVFKRKAGFRVTIGTKKKGAKVTGFHKTRSGALKPILIWAELGTQTRFSKSKTIGGKRRCTGEMPSFGFMKKTLEEERDGVTQSLHDEIRESVIKIAKKYGCK